ncbi:hypothetical protein GCM10010429_22680 [Micromonospora olivasterospora]
MHPGRVFGRCEPSTGLVPFARLVEHVMTTEPYASADRVLLSPALSVVTAPPYRSTRTLVEVRVNGEPAGTLSLATSAEMLPVLAHLSELGMLTAAHAVLKGNRGQGRRHAERVQGQFAD